MLTTLQSRLKSASRMLPVILLPFAVQAQALNYGPSGATYVAGGTYTDLGTTGTAINTTNTDDANSSAQPIGFTFNYNGQSFTQFVLNTNGFLKLGSTAPSATAMFLPETANTPSTDPFQSADPVDVNIIAPFNFDLTTGVGGTGYRVTTTGTSPNRVCTIQWKNVSDKANVTPTQYTNFSFQVKLYETSGNIDFVYDAPTVSTATAAVRYTQAGLKGSGFDDGQFVQASKTSATPWDAVTFANTIINNTLNTLNFRNNVNPIAGTTYRFAPTVPPSNDDCIAATPLTASPNCTPITVSNAGASGSTAPVPTCDNNAVNSDIWYSVVVPANGALTVTTSPVAGSNVDDTVLELYSGSCGVLTSLACNDDAAGGGDFFSSATVVGLTAGSTIYIRVWSFDNTVDPSYTGQFGLCVSTPSLPASDAAVTALYTLGTVSSTYTSPVTAQALITNAGTGSLTNVPVTFTVSGGTTYTSTQTVATLAPGASTTLSFTYPVTATGNNTLTVTVPADAITTNNSATATQTVTAYTESHFASPAPTFADGIGGNTANVTLLARYHVNSAAPVATVTPTFFGSSTATNTYQVIIYSANATTGLPGTILYTSPTRTRPATAATDPVTIPAGITVTGDFFVAVKQLTTENVGLAFVTDSPLRPATFYITSNSTTFTDLRLSPLTPRLAIDVAFGAVTATQNAALAAIVSLYPNPAHQSFKLALPAGSLNSASASLINALGQVVQTRKLNLPAAGGTADFDVSTLAAGVYSLQLKAGNDIVVKRVVVE
jgi:hypothetical protein